MSNITQEVRDGLWKPFWTWLMTDPVYERFNVMNKNFNVKHLHADLKRERQPLDNFIERTCRPLNFYDVLNDNGLRLFGLYFLERFMAVRQAMAYTSKSYLTYGNNTTILSSCTDMQGPGLLRGLYRGIGLNLLQFTGTYYQALQLSGGNAWSFVANLMVLETQWHPFDTLRTRYIADGNGSYKNFTDCMNKTRVSTLMNGVQYKWIFTGSVGLVLVNQAEGTDSSNQFNLLILGFGYSALTLKTLAQVSVDTGSMARNFGESMGLVRYVQPGLMPRLYLGFPAYLALVTAAGWSLPQIFSEDRKREKIGSLTEDWEAFLKMEKSRASMNYEKQH